MTKSNKSSLHPEDAKLAKALAEHLGWTEIFNTGGALLGRPPCGGLNSRGQAMVPNWATNFNDACELAVEFNCFPDKSHITHEHYWANQHQRTLSPGLAYRLAIMRNVMLMIKHSNYLKQHPDEKGDGDQD